MKRIFLSMGLLLNAVVFAQPGQSEFLPVAEIPASEQLPAAPLLIAAYAFVWIAVLAYLWLMWRRLGRVEQDLSALSAQLAKKRP
ncbi:MAG: CcmD family protein [Acidobacteria bacterium]|nr:CcmD family protein [Acidobacteriota bacterium]